MKKRTLSLITALALCLSLLPAAALADETEDSLPDSVPPVETVGDPADDPTEDPAEDLTEDPAEEPNVEFIAEELPGFTVFLDEEPLPFFSLLSVGETSWSNTGTFTSEVYEGYYAQLDATSQGLYNQLKTAFANSASITTSSNGTDTLNLTVDVGVNQKFENCSGTGELIDGVIHISFSQDSYDEITTWLNMNLTTAYLALERDHPEMPWLQAASFGIDSFSISMDDDTKKNEDGTYSFTAGIETVPFKLTGVPSEIFNGAETFSDAVETAVTAIDSSGTRYETVKNIHDYLCNLITYNINTTPPKNQTAYSALVDNQTVCAGYGTSFKLLCDRYGIPCIYVSGKGGVDEPENHGWNYVLMEDGNWYAVDVTWDDQDTTTSYDFFLVGSGTTAGPGWKNGVASTAFSTSHVSNGQWQTFCTMPYPTLSTTRYVVLTNLSGAEVSLGETNFIYNGSSQTPSTIAVTLDGKTLIAGTDYTVSYYNSNGGTGDTTNVGTVTVTISGTGDYKGKVTATYTIAKATPDIGTVSYGGTIYPTTSASNVSLTRSDNTVPGTLKLDEGTDFTVGTGSYTWTFTPTNTNNYETVTGTITLTVSADTLTGLSYTGTPTKTSYTYGDTFETAGLTVTAHYASGSTKDVTNSVTASALTVGEDTTVTLSYTDGQTVTCTVSGITVSKKQLNVSGMSWDVGTYTYADREQGPTLIGELPEGVKVTTDNDKATNAGDYTASATFALDTEKGYTDANYVIVGHENGLTAEWKIGKAPQAELSITGIRDPVAVGDSFTLTTSGGSYVDGAVTWTVTGDSGIATVDANTGEVKVTGEGAVTITATKAGGDNYENVTAEWRFTSTKKQQAELTITGQPNGAITYGDDVFELSTRSGDGTGAVTWEVTEGGGIASVDANTGAVTVKGVGEVTIKATKAGGDNYADATATWTFIVAQKELTLTATVESKPYDGSTAATITADLSGMVDGDDVSLEKKTIPGTFANQYVGTGKDVTASEEFKLTGADAGNYTLTQPSGLKGDITAATQTLTSNYTAEGTVYSLTKGGIAVDLSGLVSTNATGNTLTFAIDDTTCATLDDTTLTSTDTTGTVAVTVSAAAHDVDNDGTDEYTAANSITIYIKVVDKQTDDKTLTVTQANITYGGTVSPSVSYQPAGTGAVTYSYSGSNSAGISYSSSDAPTDAGSYTVTATCEDATKIYTATANFTIAKFELSTSTVKLGQNTFVYDGSSHRPVLVFVDSDQPVGDSNYTETGPYSAVLVLTDNKCYETTYTGKDNYTGSVTFQWMITPKPVTATVTAENKTYDGTTDAVVTATVNDLASGDTITITGVTGAFANANAGTGKSVTVDASNAVVTGTNGYNESVAHCYDITYQTSGVTANITKNEDTTAPEAGEGYSINYPDETISVNSGYEVVVRESEKDDAPVSNGGSITTVLNRSSQTLYIRRAEDTNHVASGWTKITLAARPDAPTAVTRVDETVKGKGDGKVTGIPAGVEYSTDGTTWKDAPGGELTKLAAGTDLYFRVKATETAPHGAYKGVKILAGPALTVTFDSRGGSSVASQDDLSYLAKVTRPDDPTREDYEFLGWYTTEDGTTKWDFDQNNVTENTTLYAQWNQLRFHVTVEVKNNSDKLVSGANVVLKQGNTIIESGTTDGDGKCTFTTSVAPGAYNIVTTYTQGGEKQTKTSLVTITDEDPTVEVKLPPVGVNSHLTVSKDDSTPDVVVGGLDDEAEELKTGDVTKVTVSMSVEAKTENEADGAAQIKQTAGTGAKLEYLEINVTKTVTTSSSDGNSEDVSETTKVLQIVVPYDFTGKKSVTVYRYHEGKAEALTESNSETEGTYQLDTANGLIHIFARKFSTYAIGYTEEGAATPTTPSRPSTSHSSGSSVTTYPVTADSAKHGTVTVSPKNASKGTTVTITVKPDDGYELDSLTVTDASGDTVKIAQKSDTKYTFTMPASKITVEAAFAKIEEQPAHSFRDVPDGFWAEDEIAWAYENGYMNGNTATTFNPNGTVTRQQLWMILARLSGERPASFAEARTWAMDNGVSDGTNPGNAVSRQQLVTILYRYAALKGYRISGAADLTAFPDHASVAAYATDAMSWSVANGIVGGTAQGTLNPTGTATRAQFAVILYRFCGNIVK